MVSEASLRAFVASLEHLAYELRLGLERRAAFADRLEAVFMLRMRCFLQSTQPRAAVRHSSATVFCSSSGE
jgi:hypothetical protein